MFKQLIVRTNNRCPVCGNHEWYGYEILAETHKVIPCSHDRFIDYDMVVDTLNATLCIDECTECGTAVSLYD